MGGRQTRAAERGEQRRGAGHAPDRQATAACSSANTVRHFTTGTPAPSRACFPSPTSTSARAMSVPERADTAGRCDPRTLPAPAQARSARSRGPHRWRGETCLSASAVRAVHDASQVIGLGRVELRRSAVGRVRSLPGNSARASRFRGQTEMRRPVDRMLTFRALGRCRGACSSSLPIPPARDLGPSSIRPVGDRALQVGYTRRARSPP